MTMDRPSSSSMPRFLPGPGVTALVALALVAIAIVAPAEGLQALTPAGVVPGVASQAEGGSGLASQTLGRGYWHVFIAYAVAWVLVLGWAISIARRLSKVEREIEE